MWEHRKYDDLKNKLLPDDESKLIESSLDRRDSSDSSVTFYDCEEEAAVAAAPPIRAKLRFSLHEQDQELICGVGHTVMTDPVQLIVKDQKGTLIDGAYLNREMASELIKRKQRCTKTQLEIVGYKDAPTKKAEIEAYLKEYPERAAALEKAEQEAEAYAAAALPQNITDAIPRNNHAANADTECARMCCILFMAVGLIAMVPCVMFLESPPCNKILLKNNAENFNVVGVDGGSDCSISRYSMPYGYSGSVWTGAAGLVETCHLDTDNVMIGTITTHGSGVRTDGDEIDGCHVETTRESGVKCTWYLKKVCDTPDINTTMTQGFLSAFFSVAFEPRLEHKPTLRGTASYWAERKSWQGNNGVLAYVNNRVTEQQQTMALSG